MVGVAQRVSRRCLLQDKIGFCTWPRGRDVGQTAFVPRSAGHIKSLTKPMAINPDPDLDKLIRKAIRHKHLIRLVYQNKDRVVEPHDYGIHKGAIKFLAYQVRGSSTGKVPGWRWFEVGGISDAHLINETFPGNRPAPSGQHHQWDEIFMRVDPPA